MAAPSLQLVGRWYEHEPHSVRRDARGRVQQRDQRLRPLHQRHQRRGAVRLRLRILTGRGRVVGRDEAGHAQLRAREHGRARRLVLLDVEDRELDRDEHGPRAALVVPARARERVDAHGPAPGGRQVREPRREREGVRRHVPAVDDGRRGRGHDHGRDRGPGVAPGVDHERARGQRDGAAAVHEHGHRVDAAPADVQRDCDGERGQRVVRQQGHGAGGHGDLWVRIPRRVERERRPDPARWLSACSVKRICGWFPLFGLGTTARTLTMLHLMAYDTLLL